MAKATVMRRLVCVLNSLLREDRLPQALSQKVSSRDLPHDCGESVPHESLLADALGALLPEAGWAAPRKQ